MADELLYVSVEDVKNRWLDALGPLPASDQQLLTLIEDAEGMILEAFPDIPARITDKRLRKSTVVRVASRMVLRVLRNPDGTRTVQESAGGVLQSRTTSGDILGEVYLTDQDRSELADRGRAQKGVRFLTPRAG